MSQGLEGKWEALNEDREELRAENERLEKERQHLSDRLKVYEESELSKVIIERDQLKNQLRDELRTSAESLLKLTDDEQEAMDALSSYMRIVIHRWKLKANASELTSAIHVLQGAVQQHMLARSGVGAWSNWWQDER